MAHASIPALDILSQGILAGDRRTLARAITVAESTLPGDQELTDQLLRKILPSTGKSIRIGITGVPGVGKSTFIETFGKHVTAGGKKLAILTVDPSSQKTGGSILGDKTRMEHLSRNTDVFIRPSPSGLALGGVTSRTRETILLCEAAGFNVIVIETVGVGQSETEVRNMVDFFLLMMLAGAGDELQGIKKGIVEMADGIVINKADGDNIKAARQAQADAAQALHMLPPPASGWKIQVLTSSALEDRGIDDIWRMIRDFEHQMKRSGYFDEQRRLQIVRWFDERVEGRLKMLLSEPKIQSIRADLIRQVSDGALMPAEAAALFWKRLMP